MYERLFLKHQWAFLKTPFLTEHFQWLLVTVAGFQLAAFLKKGLQQRCFSVRFAKFLRTSFYRTPPDDCFLYLSVILRSFSDHLFLHHLWETAYFMNKFQNFNHQIKQKYFTSAFQAINTKTRRSYSEAFIYIKSLKIICE